MIDLHKAIGKLPIIPKRGIIIYIWFYNIYGFTLPNMHYCGPYNPLNSQLEYNNEGRITKYKQFPTGKIYSICSQHDVDYTLKKFKR